MRPLLLAAICLSLGACDAGPQSSQRPPPPPADQKPASELRFLELIDASAAQYNGAVNDIVAHDQRGRRRDALCENFPKPDVRDWIGKITSIEPSMFGATVSIRLKYGANVSTWNNAISDTIDQTIIPKDSILYNEVAALAAGSMVRFSGTFVPSAEDCFKTQNISLSGAMIEPQFVMRFSAISPVE